MASKTTDNIDNICAVCSEVIEIYAVGECDHHVCFKCSTRMRVLCEQTYCSICRTELPKVIFIKKLHKYAYIETHHFLVNRRNKVYFENEEVQTAFHQLLEHSCRECTDSPIMRTFAQLKNHLRKEHSFYYCDICVKHLKIFSHERKYYSRAGLATHRRIGDKDDRSHKGHPLCEFCDERFLDNDELLRHLRKEHYFCHFCDSDGSNQYYSDYDLLAEHFKQNHYVCEEGDCLTAQFTNAFRSEIDLKAHVATEHGKNGKRSQNRQTRTLDIEFNLAPRSMRDIRRERNRHDRGVTTADDYEEVNRDGRNRSSRGRGRGTMARDREELEMAKAITASLAEAERQTGSVNVVAPELVQPRNQAEPSAPVEKFQQNTEDFPDLDGKTAALEEQGENMKEGLKGQSARSLAKKLALSSNLSVQDGDMGNEEFPALGGPAGKVHPTSHGGFWNKTTSSHTSVNRNIKSRGVIQVVRNAPSASSNTNSKSLHDFPTLASSRNASIDVKPKIPGLNFAPVKKSPVHSPHLTRKVSEPDKPKKIKQVQEDYPALGKPSKPVADFTTVSVKKVTESKPVTEPDKPKKIKQVQEDYPALGRSSKPVSDFTTVSVKKVTESKPVTEPDQPRSLKQESDLPKTVKAPQEDFPALGKPSKPIAHFTTAPVKKVTKPEPHQSKSQKQESDQPKTVKETQEDFPALGKPSKPIAHFTTAPVKKVKKPKSVTANTVTDTKNLSSLGEISKTLSATTAKQKPVSPVEDEYPQLESSPRSGSADSNKGKNKKSKKSSKKTNSSDVDHTESSSDSKDNNKGDVAVISSDIVSIPEISSKASHTSADIDAQTKLNKSESDSLVEQKQVKSKPANKRSKNQFNAEDFPSLSKNTPTVLTHSSRPQKNILKDDDFPSLNDARDPVNVQTNGWAGKSHAQSAKPENSDGDFVKMKGKGKKKKGKKNETEEEHLQKFADDNPFDFTIKTTSSKEEVRSEIGESEKEDRVTRNNKKKSVKEADPVKKEDFLSLSGVTKENLEIKPNDLDVSKEIRFFTEALKDSSNVNLSDRLLEVQSDVNLADDFPTLVKGSAPPPGFSSAKKNPPPGFSASQEKKLEIGPPSGTSEFSSSAGQQLNLSEIGSVLNNPKNTNIKSESTVYLQPPGFQQRNTHLIQRIQLLIGEDQDKFGKFRQWSGQFRKGQVSGEDYYEQCAQLMGKSNFLTIFPELLVLLPDIEKQQQLLTVYKKQPKSVEQRTKRKSEVFKVAESGAAWNTKGGEQFPVCSVCMQVLTPDDIRPHYVEHNIDEEYPSLSLTANPRNQFGMGAWVKT